MNKFLVIGLGAVGIEYDLNQDRTFKDNQSMSHVKSILDDPDSELTACVEPDLSKLELLKNMDFTKIYPSIAEAFAKHNFDMVIISSPTITHFNIIKELEKYPSIKKVLCEKPFGSIQPNKCSDIDTNFLQKMAVNYFRRSMPEFKELKFFIQQHYAPTQGFFTYSGDFASNCSHAIDLLLWMFPGEEHIVVPIDHENHFNIKIGDNTFTFIKNHSVTTIFSFKIWNENFLLSTSSDERFLELYFSEVNSLQEKLYTRLYKKLELTYNFSQKYALRDFSNKFNDSSLASIEDACKVNKIIKLISSEVNND